MAPAAANYYSAPPHAHHKQRGYRICDTCGAIENPTIQKFRLCGGCVSASLSFRSRSFLTKYSIP